jgi:hypothetical protein
MIIGSTTGRAREYAALKIGEKGGAARAIGNVTAVVAAWLRETSPVGACARGWLEVVRDLDWMDVEAALHEGLNAA